MITQITYEMFPGTAYIQDALLSNAFILCVRREGIQYDFSNSTLGSRELNYTAGPGRIDFLTAAGGPPEPGGTVDIPVERVNVLIKI